jgi:hypothetical protein
MRERIVKFLEKLECSGISVSDTSDWVRASCPLAPWTHKDGRDDHPSFGVKVPEEGRPAAYHCFACGRKGTLAQLLHTLTWLSGESPTEALHFLLDHFDDVDAALDEDEIQRKRRYVREAPEIRILDGEMAVPKEILAKYPLLSDIGYTDVDATKVVRWLADERGISEEAIQDFQLRFYRGEMGELGVVFPTVSRSGLTYDLRVRLIDSKSFFRLTPKMTSSLVDYKAELVFFGEHLVGPNALTWMVEGELDALRLYSLGEKAVIAIQGSFSRRRIFGLPSSSVVIAFDADQAGYDKLKEAKEVLSKHANQVFAVNWGWVGIKDPGELTSFRQLEEVKKRMIVLYPTARDILSHKKRLTKGDVLDKIKRKLAKKRQKKGKSHGKQ